MLKIGLHECFSLGSYKASGVLPLFEDLKVFRDFDPNEVATVLSPPCLAVSI